MDGGSSCTIKNKRRKTMNLNQCIFTQNACYKAGVQHTVRGVMVHSTGANNPNLRRYVAPNDGKLGKNQYQNDWNRARPDGREVCVHAFIGKLADGGIATYQTLPWEMRGWHSGSGSKGGAANANNNGYIGFEICEDDLTSAEYFTAVYKEAAELTAHLCTKYGLDPMADGVVICHSEGWRRGIASNHGDVLHWFPRYGKSMDTFREDVRALMTDGEHTPAEQQKPAPPPPVSKIAVGDKVRVKKGAKTYDGKKPSDFVYDDVWVVYQVKGDRVVLDKNAASTNAIMTAYKADDLTQEQQEVGLK